MDHVGCQRPPPSHSLVTVSRGAASWRPFLLCSLLVAWSPNHVLDRGRPMPARTLPTISPTPISEPSEMAANRLPGRNLGFKGVLEIVRRDPKFLGRGGVFLA